MAPSIQPVQSRPAQADGCSQRGQQMSHARATSLGLLPRPQSTSFKMLRLKNGDGQKKSRPVGNACTELSVHGIKGVQTMVRRARNPEGEIFSLSTNFSPEKGGDRELRRDFSALILSFPDKVLADAADCSPETVKCWKAERSFPHGRHLMKLVADFPKIRAWHDRRTGGTNHPQSQAEMFAYLEKVMASDTAEGRAMRARFQQIVVEMG